MFLILFMLPGECTEGNKSGHCGCAATNTAECDVVKRTRCTVADLHCVSQAACVDLSYKACTCYPLSTARTGKRAASVAHHRKMTSL